MSVLLEYTSPSVYVRWSSYDDGEQRVEVDYTNGSFQVYWFDTTRQAEVFIDSLGI